MTQVSKPKPKDTTPAMKHGTKPPPSEYTKPAVKKGLPTSIPDGQPAKSPSSTKNSKVDKC